MTNLEQPPQIDGAGRFILKDYDQRPPFSSFLPGIAGTFGIPMWTFYINRGQAISSFGIESKDHPLLEFQPANKAYQLTDRLGFRTFIKANNRLIEPFTSCPRSNVNRDMYIGINQLEIRETDLENGLETQILYFNLTNEPCAGLVRQVSITNLSPETLALEVLDGLPAVYPYGVNNDQLKQIGRTIEAWMEVLHLKSNLPFFRLRASAEDTSAIHSFQAGNYALAAAAGGLLPPVVDPRVLFGTDTSFRHPQTLLERGLAGMLAMDQIQEGRTPCAFFGASLRLAPGDTEQITSLYGYAKNYQLAEELKSKLPLAGFIKDQASYSEVLAQKLTDPIATQSGLPLFDAYTRQTFLDNLLRGGWPLLLGGKHPYHIYSRKHGDPERDYNRFFLAADNYSQGNGSYRDVNQNRRSDVLFEPRVADFNIRLFASLIQTDGYNPLVVEGTRFSLPKKHWPEVLALVSDPDRLLPELSGTFTPGMLLNLAQESELTVSSQELIERVFALTEQHIEADFGEGYWVDHWTYNLDQIESYLTLFPDRKSELLYDSDPLPFYDSPAVVNPRSKKYVLDNDQPRQFNALTQPKDKSRLIKERKTDPNWVRTKQGQGEIFRLPLISKLVLLAIIKFSSLDPAGMGIEMEAGRPGWNDALNGLPGIFGSSLAASYELGRLVDFLIVSLKEHDRPVSLPIEAQELLEEILQNLVEDLTSFERWDRISSARENYRHSTRLGVEGTILDSSPPKLVSALEKMEASLQTDQARAQEFSGAIPPTYFTYEVTEFDILSETDPENRPFIKPSGFNPHPLPLFLEGPVHKIKILSGKAERQELYHLVRESGLFDPVLETYKLNTSLSGEPFSIGRARAFSPGWLENESIWLHMTLKYLLEVLKSGLYEQFFTDLQQTLPPFLEPALYARSPLENSSFIVSSAHPDPSLHGRGFVARLSGATAEFISIWFTLMTGGKPFTLDPQGSLQLKLQPALPGWFFNDQGFLEFSFLGDTLVRVHNPERKDTWGAEPSQYQLHTEADQQIISGPVIPEPHASAVRDGHYKQIDIYF